MPRSKPSSSFGSRSARFKKLESGREHWIACDEGVYLGYRRGKIKSTWYLRRYEGNGAYGYATLGLADDYQDADGEDVLTYFQAQDLAKKRAREASNQDKPLPKRRGYTVADAISAYLDHYRATSNKTTREYERIFNRDVIPKLGARPLEQLSRVELIQWRDGLIRQTPKNRASKTIETDVPEAEQKRRRKATAQRKWTMLRAALNHAFTDGEAESDTAWRSVRPLQGIAAPPPSRILTVKECRVVTSKLPADFRPLAQATYLTGAAYKELRETIVDDYMPSSGHLRIANTKRRARLVPLTDEGRRLFDDLTAGRSGDDLIFVMADGAPWGKSVQSRRMRAASVVAKMRPGVTLTDLRDAYGSLLLNAGVPLEVVSNAMGHASITTTARHYAHLLQSTVDKQIRDALPNLGIKKKSVTRLASK